MKKFSFWDLFKNIRIYYDQTEVNGEVHSMTDVMKLYELVYWFNWMSPPTWAVGNANQGVKTIITKIEFVR